MNFSRFDTDRLSVLFTIVLPFPLNRLSFWLHDNDDD